MVHLLRRFLPGPDYGHGCQCVGGDYSVGPRGLERPGSRRHSGRLPSFTRIRCSGLSLPLTSGRRVRGRDATGARSSRLPVLSCTGLANIKAGGRWRFVRTERRWSRARTARWPPSIFPASQPPGVPDRSGGQRATEQCGAGPAHFAFRRRSGACGLYTPAGGVAQSSNTFGRVFQWHPGADPLFVGAADQRAGSLRDRRSEHRPDAGSQPTDYESRVRDPARWEWWSGSPLFFSRQAAFESPFPGCPRAAGRLARAKPRWR
jgi:hypothetical protein